MGRETGGAAKFLLDLIFEEGRPADDGSSLAAVGTSTLGHVRPAKYISSHVHLIIAVSERFILAKCDRYPLQPIIQAVIYLFLSKLFSLA
jgi:hypothetical protein